MEDVDALRRELGELREAAKLMFGMTMLTIASSDTSAQALQALIANVGQLQKTKERGEVFDEWSTAALLALSSAALKRHPDDPAMREIYQGLRPGSRH